MDLGAALEAQRLRLNPIPSWSEVARAAWVSRPALLALRNGTGVSKPETVAAVERALGLDDGWINRFRNRNPTPPKLITPVSELHPGADAARDALHDDVDLLTPDDIAAVRAIVDHLLTRSGERVHPSASGAPDD